MMEIVTMTESETRRARRAFSRFFSEWIDFSYAYGLFTEDIITGVKDAVDEIGFFPVESVCEQQETIEFLSADGERISIVFFDDGRIELMLGNDDDGIEKYVTLKEASRWETEATCG